MNWLRKGAVRSREGAAALIIVLAFVVLLTGLGVAYLSRTTSDRQVAHSSFNQSNVDQLAQSAMDNIIGDLRQEIVDGSTASTVNGITIYTPTSAANMVPQRSGNPATVPNLIRRSVRADAIPAPGRPSRASAVNSTNDLSANGRSVTATRWNSHYLVPKANTTDDSVPISDFANATPDWVFVTTAGATPAPAPANVIGRYSYAIYDEGGLLDINLAGYPTGTAVSESSGKISLAFADLTALPLVTPTPNANFVVGWRNYATTQPTNNFPDTLPASQAFAKNLSSPISTPSNLYTYVVNNPIGPLTVRSDVSPYNNRTDQMFLGRQQLIAFQKTSNANNGVPIASTRQFGASALQYLGTFSRETAGGIPQWTGPSPTPTSVNPNFQTLLVTGSFIRNDGTTANIGDPLVYKPFLLQRLNWLTYNGPSAGRTIPNREPNRGDDPDWDMWLLTGQFGLTSTFLQQGTAANILKYFGLVWDTTNERWNYTGPSGGSLASSIATFGAGGTQAGTREPNFFELLQAGILNDSIGDASSSDPSLPSAHQQSKMLHILTIGANLIAQSRADSYPVRIACNVGGTTMEAVGMPRLPCISSLAACPIGGAGLTGGVNWLLVPNLWDPFRDTWDLTEPSPSHLKYPRPLVRITVSGGIGFGSATVTQSGSVNPTSVTVFPATSTGMNASLTLATGNSTYGRDGLREAMRLGTNDISSTVPLFDPTQSPGLSVVTQWNRVARPTNDPPSPPYRTDPYIVFRLSLPGILIVPLSILGQKPVLILQPGFQVRIDYQSPTDTAKWYPYSFLQGNNATNTWITANPALGLCLGTSFSQYFLNIPPPPGALPTIVNSGTLTPTPWIDVTGALAHAPMFAKSDPRSIRYNSMIGVVNLANPPMSFASADVIGSIWPAPYATPPPMSPSAYPIPTPTPNANPVTLGDNAVAGNSSNPYGETTGVAWRPLVMNRPFRSVGEMAYAFRDQPFRTLSFSSANSPDAALLDLFSVNDYPRPAPTVSPSPTSTPRAGVINVNSRQGGAIAAVIAGTTRVENAVAPTLVAATDAINTGTIFTSLSAPVTNKAGLANLIANTSLSPPSLLNPSVPKTEREAIARALGEADQARTWNLLIDVIAQGGQYVPGTTSVSQANKFVVNGEQRYWIHVAIDRFTGQVIDKQIEVVNE